MTDESTGAAERELERHAAFERDDDGFEATSTPFEAAVRVAPADGAVEYRVRVRAPTIDAAVAGETVAPVVREGWLETFERRLEDVGGATRSDPEPPTVDVDESTDEVVVESAIVSERPTRAVDDVKAIVDYVEGTYVEGIIPGYEYRGPASELLGRARERSQGGGTPL